MTGEIRPRQPRPDVSDSRLVDTILALRDEVTAQVAKLGDVGEISIGGAGGAFIVEMSTAPGCVPCADLWNRLGALGQRYGWKVRTIGSQEAMLRSGRLGLPWVGHPVAWVRPVSDPNRIIPVAIGTDHEPNLARNLYLAAKMLTGVKPTVGVRGMSKFTGIVAASPRPVPNRARN